MNELALFAGGGGGIMGGKLLGWRTVCAVEIDPDARGTLLTQQHRGKLPSFPIWDDVTTFAGPQLEIWRGRVDIVTGGFPCQGVSLANAAATGLADSRSGLWSEFARIIGVLRPGNVLVENSPALTFRGLGTVLADLAAMGYDARWGCVCSADSGGPIIRKRIWIRARPAGQRWKGRLQTPGPRQPGQVQILGQRAAPSLCGVPLWMDKARAGGFRSATALARGVDRARLRIIGNGQDPHALVDAWNSLEF